MVWRASLWVFAVAVASCPADPKTGHPVAAPEAVGRSFVGYGENARGFPPDVVYGWNLQVAGGVATWRECSSAEVCSEVERERPTAELLAFQAVGQAAAPGDAGEVEVFKLTLKTRRRNIMPRSP